MASPQDDSFLIWNIICPTVQFLSLIPVFIFNLKVQKVQFKDDSKDLKMVDASVLTVYMFIAVAVINLVCMVIFEIIDKDSIVLTYATQMISGWLILNCMMTAVMWTTTFKIWRAAW